MKAKIDGKEVNLIPYKGDSSLWWDGSDESKIYPWAKLSTLHASSLNSSYSATRLKIGVSVKGAVEGLNTPD